MLITLALIILIFLIALTHLHRYITHTRVLDRLERMKTVRIMFPHYTNEETRYILNRSASFKRLGAV